MEIRKTIFVKQCDIVGCGNIWEYVVTKNPEDTRTHLFLCENCANELKKCLNSIKKNEKTK